jgi:Tol biopolymer transport system component
MRQGRRSDIPTNGSREEERSENRSDNTRDRNGRQDEERAAPYAGAGSGFGGIGGAGRYGGQAEAALTEKLVFTSERTKGAGVDNPTGDSEIFKMNPDGTGLKQLTFNEVHDFDPELSTDGTRITYGSSGKQKSNPEGDDDVYVMNALDGSGKKNLSDSADGVYDYYPAFSPDSTKIAYQSNGVQVSNPEGDYEVYVMNALDGSGKKNLSNNASSVDDSPAYWGVQGI